MPLDPNIIMGVKPLQVENPVNQLGQILQLQGAQQANQLNAMKMGEYQQQQERRNGLLKLIGGLPSNATDEQRSAALKGGGYFDEADKLDKGVLERMKTKSEVSAKDIETARKRIELAGSALKYVIEKPTLENANAALDYLGLHGIYSPEQVAQYKAQVAQNPAAIQQLADVAYRSALSAKDQLPAFDNFSAGDRHVTQQRDPVTGAIKEVGSVTIKESEPQRLAREQQAAEAAKNRALTERGQNMTDSRARDANSIKAGEKKATEDLTKGSQLASFDTMLGTLDRLAAHPGLPKTVGLRSVLPTIPGGDSANFQAELNTFQSQAFIPMVAQLKGMGALSDAEGKKLTQAVGALDPKMGEAAFRESIDRIKADMEAAYARVAGKPRDAGTPPAPKPGAPSPKPAKVATDADYNALPSGAVFIGPDGKQRRKP